MKWPKPSIIIKILVSLFLLALLLWLKRETFGEIWNLLRSINIPIFSLAFLVFISSIIFMSWRLRIALAAQKAFFKIKNLCALTFIGYFFNNFMPTSVGGDLIKAYYISKKVKNKLLSYASVFVDRAAGMFSLVLIASVALVIMRRDIQQRLIFLVVGLLFLFCIISALLFLNKELLKKLGSCFGLARLLQALKLDSLFKKAYNAVNIYREHKAKVVQIFTLSLTAQFISFFNIYLLSVSLGVHIPFGKILLIMPIIAVLLMLPISFNGLGLREWAFIFFFSPNMGDAAAFSLSLLFFAMYLLTSLIGGATYLFYMGGNKQWIKNY